MVPFDLEMDPAERTLLISGPNTGGKTVLLKAVGLASAMAQSGIVPPVGAGSRLPAFGGFFADIGDHQSIAASLSTFSAHVAMLRRILADADAGTLVLLDEVGSGTDPAEGAALARRYSRVAYRARGAHARDHASRCAQGRWRATRRVWSTPRSSSTPRPLRRRTAFVKGVPGRSYGLAIARRLGIEADILADAEGRVPDAERNLDALLAAVEERGREGRETQARLEQREAGLEALQARLGSAGREPARPRGGAEAVGEGRRPGRSEAGAGST